MKDDPVGTKCFGAKAKLVSEMLQDHVKVLPSSILEKETPIYCK